MALLRWRAYGRNNKGNIEQTYMLSSSIYNNLLSVGYDYNTENGVKTSWMQNVNGNWDINALQKLHWDFGNMRRFFLENTTRLTCFEIIPYPVMLDDKFSRLSDVSFFFLVYGEFVCCNSCAHTSFKQRRYDYRLRLLLWI